MAEQDLQYTLHCSKCTRTVEHTFTFLSKTTFNDDENQLWGGEISYEGHCNSCRYQSFVLKRAYNSEDVEMDYNHEEDEISTELCYRNFFFRSVNDADLRFDCDFTIPEGERDSIPDSVLPILLETSAC